MDRCEGRIRVDLALMGSRGRLNLHSATAFDAPYLHPRARLIG